MDYDPLLKIIVEISTEMADSTQGQVETGITLQVGGMLVTGHIIPVRQFLLEHPLTDRILEAYEKLEKQDPTPEEDKNDAYHYIHLSGARIFLPGQPPIPTQGEGVYWRGRISEVSGFWFRNLTVSDGD
jgi:hypothetical protein